MRFEALIANNPEYIAYIAIGGAIVGLIMFWFMVKR